MDKYDTSQLTEFPRFEPESTQSGVSTFFNKFWKFPIFSPNEPSEDSQSKVTEGNENVHSDEQKNQEYGDKAEIAYTEETEGRSVPNVLRRISSVVTLGSGVRAGTKYSDTELARYWMPDDISRECYECAARFSALRRRHHCRVCGQIFCSRCCSQTVPGHIFGCAGYLRVCNYCCNVVLSYLKENDLSGEISPDLRSLQENLQIKFPEHGRQQASKARDNFVFAREQEERCELRSSPKEPLHDVYNQLAFTLPTQQHRYRLVRYSGVWRGCDILQWVMDNTNNKCRAQATLVCQTLLSAGYMECMTELPQFADYALYRPVVLPPRVLEDDDSPAEECNRLVESVSSYCLDLNLGDSSARLIKTSKAETKSTSSCDEVPPVMEHNEVQSESKHVCPAIVESGEEHLTLLMRQCLARQALPPTWLDVLYPLCVLAAEITSPDVHSNDIDIRHYVQVKKVPGGTMRESCVVQGVVLTKNVAHRGMPQQITNPTILLLDCSIAYQRVEGKLTSLEPVLLQEQEYLSRCAARIVALRARVVLARGRVSRAVQDAVRAHGLALACAVPAAALRRAARCVRADPLASIDARVGTPRLGTCDNFYVKTFSDKTLMVLEGCAAPHLGCCILLRGASLQELIRVKKVVKFMLLACYNWKLEKSFLGDIEAILPGSATAFADDTDDNDAAKSNDDQNDLSNKALSDVSVNDSNVTSEDYAKADENYAENPKKSESLMDDKIAVDEEKNVNGKDKFVKESESQQREPAFSEASSNNSPSNDSFNDDKIFCNFSGTVAPKAEITGNIDTPVNDNSANRDNSNKIEEIYENTLKLEGDLQDGKQFRKTDSDKNLSCGIPIRDFSDPLRSTLSVEDDVFLPKEEEELKADDHTDRWSTDDVVLVMSPNMIIPPPYSETEAGRRSSLRDYLPRTPQPLRVAPQPHTTPPASHRRVSRPSQENVPLREDHPFISEPITTSADDPALKASLAHYRAVGCPPLTKNHKPSCPMYKPSVLKKIPKEPVEEGGDKKESNEPLDPFAPENHQRISLLLYSFSNKSANVPDFCVNPWIVTMEMYGRHDISLGGFLDKYCFNGDNKCTSSNCQVPLNQHVRRFVHGDVCITITCNTIGHSNVDKVREEQTKQVMFWSRCEACGASGRAVRVRACTLAISLAQYLRWRCAAPRYARARACAHPLHAHAHAFVCRLTTATFRYSKISTYDVELPPDVISTKYDINQIRHSLITQLNDLMLKGHETFSGLSEPEAEKEYLTFKQQMEQIHLALTSNSLQEHTTLAGVIRSLWNVSDGVISGEKMLRDAQDRWSNPPAKANKSLPEVTADDKSDIEDPAELGTTYVFSGDSSSKELDREHAGTEEDEEKGDKKTVRQILSQLLSNNQPANQVGMIVSSGLLPVVVQAGEVGSVVAATLASLTYRRACSTYRHNTQSDQDDLDSNLTGKEKTDGDKMRQAKSNDHVEVLLKDGLVCRVYYAAQFASLRHSLIAPLDPDSRPKSDAKCRCHEKGLCDIEEGFIRSLAHCVPWAARGGKSGSTFCKTKDDRYVLKEMTKPEWQQFLEFAPHYFNYINTCRQNKQPSLLARIAGVYSVGGAGNGVLVMENVWYSCSARARRYDLKGSSRHRLAPDTQPLAVLMDENLLNLRWEQPLYVEWGTGSALWSCLERDTALLARLGVMDYSLLLGIDNNTLVLGIIDYIRTFTWDKKLEHLVKKNLGSGQPTVVSPEQYKRRFLTACRKYFLQVPSHWDMFHSNEPQS